MNERGKIALQLTILIFVCALLVFLFWFFTRESMAGSLEHSVERALRSISGTRAVIQQEPVDDVDVRTKYLLEDRSVVIFAVGNGPWSELGIMYAFSSDGSYTGYRIAYLNDSLRGWDRGNGFASTELREGQVETPRTRYWFNRIEDLKEAAQEYAR